MDKVYLTMGNVEAHQIQVQNHSIFINNKKINAYVFWRQLQEEVPSTIIAESHELHLDEMFALAEYMQNNITLTEEIYRMEQARLLQRILDGLRGEYYTLKVEHIQHSLSFIVVEAVSLFILYYALHTSDFVLLAASSFMIIVFSVGALLLFLKRHAHYLFNSDTIASKGTMFGRDDWSVAVKDIEEIELRFTYGSKILVLITTGRKEYRVQVTKSIAQALDQLPWEDQIALRNAGSHKRED